MNYSFIAIADADIPAAVEPAFEHVVVTYVSETNKTASRWRAVPDDRLDFKPHERVSTLREILQHQLKSERYFFAEFLGLNEPPAEEVIMPTTARVTDYITQFTRLAKRRLPALANAETLWWLEPRPFFEGLQRQRIWIFWRRVLHSCHHRTQVQSWLRLAGCRVPGIYGPSADG